jgi:hypothetical protein
MEIARSATGNGSDNGRGVIMDRVTLAGLLDRAMRAYSKDSIRRGFSLNWYLAWYLRTAGLKITTDCINRLEDEHERVWRRSPMGAPVWSDYYADRIIVAIETGSGV